ncbi:C-X-C chemokine receptor type 3-like [Aulostomus maculatus]
MDVDLDGLFQSNTTYDYRDDYNAKDYDTTPEDYGATNSEVVWMPLLYSVVLAVGLLGNSLLLVALARRRQMWSTSDSFILYLSVSDLLLLVTLPLWAAQASHRGGWCFTVFFCSVSRAIFKINFFCGIFLLACISLDCCLSIVHAKQLYPHKNPRYPHIICLTVWFISLLLTIPDWVYIELEKDPQRKERSLCILNHNYRERRLVSCLLPHLLSVAATLIICYSCITLCLKWRCKSLQKQRAVMLILILAMVFFLCWTPYNVTVIVDTYRSGSRQGTQDGSSGSSSSFLKTSLMITSALGCAHACLRPLLFFSLCTNFRKWTLGALSCASLEIKGSMWELSVGGETLPDQTHDGEEMKQMTSVVDQGPIQC